LKIVESVCDKYLLNEIGHVPSVFGKNEYQERIDNVRHLMGEWNYTHLVIYGDREHFSNICYFTGYDPRFEEALLIIDSDGKLTIIVGSEGIEYIRLSPVEMDVQLFESLGLMGQPRDTKKNLHDFFRSAGITENSKVGVLGWKYYLESEQNNSNLYFEVPHFVIKNLEDIVGWKNLSNAGDLLMHPDYGLRSTMSVNELAVAEMAGTKASQSVLRVLHSLEEGRTEIESSKDFLLDADPLVAHPNLNFGEFNAGLGLASPYERKLAYGDIVNVGMGYRYSMVARTGIFVESKKDLPSEKEGIVENLYIPYFKMLAAWYEALSIGEPCGKVYKEALSHISFEREKFGIALNPGHLINSDEWTNSPFFEDSKYKLKSGMAIQCDIIAAPGEPYIGAHVEDGLILADSQMRKSLEELYPESWNRITRRRTYLKDVIGIELSEEVLPLSDIQATLNPYYKNLKVVLAKG